MNQFEQYKRLIKLGFALILVALLTGLYGVIWINWYNKIIWAPFFRRGNWMMIFIYGLLLIFFMQLYGGFKIALLKRGNLIYSQILAVVVTNIITYFQISVQDKKFTAPAPLVVNLIGAVVIILAWTMTFLWLYRGMFPPRELLLISGDHSDYHLIEKMNAREDKYIISQIVSYHEGPERIKAEIAKYDSVIVGDIPAHERNYIIKYCFGQNIRTYSVPKISDILLRSSVELNLFDSPLLLSRNNQGLQIEQEIMKRIIDIVGSLIGIVITIPIFLIVGICIKMTDGGPVIYQQTRLTKNGKKFQIYKFRTMVQNAEADGKARLATGIQAVGDKIQCDNAEVEKWITPDTMVSMNMWAGYPDFLRYIDEGFSRFLDHLGDNQEKKEYLLPNIVAELLEKDAASVKVLETSDRWIGITYKEDIEPAQEKFREMMEEGIYPKVLWN